METIIGNGKTVEGMEMITGNGMTAEDQFQVQTKQGNLLSEV